MMVMMVVVLRLVLVMVVVDTVDVVVVVVVAAAAVMLRLTSEHQVLLKTVVDHRFNVNWRIIHGRAPVVKVSLLLYLPL